MNINKLEQKLTNIGKRYHQKRMYIKQHPEIEKNRQRMRCERKLNILGRKIDRTNRQIDKLYQKAAKAKKRRPKIHANAYYKEITMHYKQREFLKRQCKALKAGTVTRLLIIHHYPLSKKQFKVKENRAKTKYEEKYDTFNDKDFLKAFLRYHPFFEKDGKYYKSVGNMAQKIGPLRKHYHQETL